jgi:hypothetical protein
VWLRIYCSILRLYPASHVGVFGSEMLELTHQLQRDAASDSRLWRTVFYARELAGLVGGAASAHMRHDRSSDAAWPRTAVSAVAFYALCAWAASLLGIRVLYSPLSWVLLVAVAAVLAWRLGKRANWAGLVAAGALGMAGTVASESVWMVFVERWEHSFSYPAPGLSITVAPDGTPPLPLTPGIRFSYLKILPDGTQLQMLNSRPKTVPPYRLFGGVAFLLVAVWSQRRETIASGVRA